MFSKVVFGFSAFALVATLFVSGCSVPLNESPPKSVAPEAKLDFDSQCLKNSLPVMRQFIEGTAEPTAVSGTWDCFRDGIGLFQKEVKGETRNTYTPREVATFFENYFLGTVRLNDRLLGEVMHLKQIMVGGSDQQITRDELTKLMSFSDQMRDLSLRLLPHMPVLAMKWKTQGNLSEELPRFDRANLEIQEVAKILGDRIASNNQPYTMTNAAVLFEELSKLYNENWGFVKTIQDGIPLLQKFKKALVGGSETEIDAAEWRRFSLLGMRGYIQYLRYFYFIEPNGNASRKIQVRLFSHSIDDFLSLLGDMVNEKPDRQLTSQELTEVLKATTDVFQNLAAKLDPVAFVTQLMNVKPVLFGGSTDKFLPEEFAKARLKIEILRSAMDASDPYLELYLLDWKPTSLKEPEAEAFFMKASRNLELAGVALGKVFESSYDLNQLPAFAAQLDRLLTSKVQERRFASSVTKALPLLVALKKGLIGGDQVVQQPEWTSLVTLGTRVLSQYLRTHYFLSSDETVSSFAKLSRENQIKQVARVVDDFLIFMNDVIGVKPSHQFEKNELVEVLNGVTVLFEDFKLRLNPTDFANSVMNLKTVLLGGTNERFVPGEFAIGHQKVEVLHDLYKSSHPFQSVYLMDWNPAGLPAADAERFFREASTQLVASATRLGKLFESDYNLHELQSLARQLDLILYSKESDRKLGPLLQKSMPLLVSLKQSLVGGTALVSLQEWPRVANLGSRAYAQFLRYHYFIKDNSGVSYSKLSVVLDEALGLLEWAMRTKLGNELTETEITNLLNAAKPFLPSLGGKLPQMSDAILKLKAQFFGGSTNALSLNDLVRIKPKIMPLFALLESNRDSLDLYLGKWNPESLPAGKAKEMFAEAQEKLPDLGEQIGEVLNLNFNLKNLAKVGEELDVIFPSPDDTSLKLTLERYTPVLVSIKEILTQQAGPNIRHSELPELLRDSAEFYGHFLQAHYFLKGQSYRQGQGLETLSELVENATRSVDGVITRRSGRKQIQQSELVRLIQAAGQAKLLPSNLSAKVLSQDILDPLIRDLLEKVLVRPKERLKGLKPDGLTKEATIVIRKEFQLWVNAQQFVDDLFPSGNEDGYTGSELVRRISNGSDSEALRELKMSLESPVPLSFDSTGRLYISKRPLLYDRQSLDNLNLARTLTRMVNNSYIADFQRITSYRGFTKAEVNELYKDFKPLAVELGMIEQSNLTFADSRFLEASLFTPHADGNTVPEGAPEGEVYDLVSFKEGVDLVLMILSGLELDSSLKQSLRRNCKVTAAGTPQESVGIGCFLQVYHRAIPTVFTSMPEFRSYAQNMSRDDFDMMMMGFLKGSGWEETEPGQLKLVAASLVPHIIQYAEMAMAKFDTDHDGTLFREEALRAYPLFRSTLLSVSPLNGEMILKGGYAYVLVYLKIPSVKDPVELGKFLSQWIHQEDSWPIEVPRKRLAEVLAAIRQLLNTADTPKSKRH